MIDKYYNKQLNDMKGNPVTISSKDAHQLNEYNNNKLVLCIGLKNNWLLLGTPNSDKEHACVTDWHIGAIINMK